jgi:hypothetical protein
MQMIETYRNGNFLFDEMSLTNIDIQFLFWILLET